MTWVKSVRTFGVVGTPSVVAAAKLDAVEKIAPAVLLRPTPTQTAVAAVVHATWLTWVLAASVVVDHVALPDPEATIAPADPDPVETQVSALLPGHCTPRSMADAPP